MTPTPNQRPYYPKGNPPRNGVKIPKPRPPKDDEDKSGNDDESKGKS